MTDTLYGAQVTSTHASVDLQQDLFDAMEPDIDGVKFAGGAVMAMQRSGVAQLLGVAHDNGAYASCAGGSELAVEKVHGSSLCSHLRHCKLNFVLWHGDRLMESFVGKLKALPSYPVPLLETQAERVTCLPAYQAIHH